MREPEKTDKHVFIPARLFVVLVCVLERKEDI